MSKPSEEELFEEQIVRTKALVAQLSQCLLDAEDHDARAALAMVMATRCVANENPDRVFLESVDAAFAVFRDLTNAKYRNEDKAVS